MTARRGAGLALTALGAFLAAAALLLSLYAPARLAVYPASTYLSTQLAGHGVTYFSPTRLREVSGATVRMTTTVRGNPFLGAPDTVVWDQFTSLYDATHHVQISASQYRLPFDRRTGELSGCCGANVNGSPGARLAGHYQWPVGTRPVTYQLFDPVMQRPWPARYTGTASAGGIRVYRFTEQVPPTRIGWQVMPASLAGGKGGALVRLAEVYTASSVFSVDPVTGAQLGQAVTMRLTLADAAGRQRILLLRGSMTLTPASRRQLITRDRSARARAVLVARTVPLAAAGLALAVLLTGILLARPRHSGQRGQQQPGEKQAQEEPGRDEPGTRQQEPGDPAAGEPVRGPAPPGEPADQDIAATVPFPRPMF